MRDERCGVEGLQQRAILSRPQRVEHAAVGVDAQTALLINVEFAKQSGFKSSVPALQVCIDSGCVACDARSLVRTW